MTRNALIAVSCLVASCHSEPPPATEPPAEGSSEPIVEVPSEPAMPNGASLLLGEFEYVASHNSIEIRRAIRVTSSSITRLVDGRVTSESSYAIVEDHPGRVTVEVHEDGRPPARRSFEFSDEDHVADVVTPELVFSRTTSADEVAPPPEGSAEPL